MAATYCEHFEPEDRFLVERMTVAIKHRIDFLQQSDSSSSSTEKLWLHAVDDWQFLAQGGYGRVYSGVYGRTRIAIKLFNKTASPEAAQEFDKEVQAAQRINHDHVVSFIAAFRHLNCMAIAMELVEGGNLRQYLKDHPVLEWTRKLQMAEEIASGLKHLHDKHILHGDLSATNILLDASARCKIADFGFSIVKKESRKSSLQAPLDQICGTPAYIAPELVGESAFNYTHKCDVYHLIRLLIWILYGSYKI